MFTVLHVQLCACVPTVTCVDLYVFSAAEVSSLISSACFSAFLYSALQPVVHTCLYSSVDINVHTAHVSVRTYPSWLLCHIFCSTYVGWFVIFLQENLKSTRSRILVSFSAPALVPASTRTCVTATWMHSSPWKSEKSGPETEQSCRRHTAFPWPRGWGGESGMRLSMVPCRHRRIFFPPRETPDTIAEPP